jgi:hypothetical protein
VASEAFYHVSARSVRDDQFQERRSFTEPMLGQRDQSADPGAGRPRGAAAMEEGNLRMTVEGGKEAFPILPAYDPQASKAVIHRLKPRHRAIPAMSLVDLR